jgi:transcriptional regulator NrdR family protein
MNGKERIANISLTQTEMETIIRLVSHSLSDRSFSEHGRVTAKQIGEKILQALFDLDE